MDVSEITVYLQSIGSVNEQLLKIIKDQCRKHLEAILCNIAENTDISLSELRQKYLSDIEFGDFMNSSVLTKSKKKIETSLRCCAKTSKGDRCTRKKKIDRFCGSHEHSRPYGEISNDDDSSITMRSKPLVRKKPAAAAALVLSTAPSDETTGVDEDSVEELEKLESVEDCVDDIKDTESSSANFDSE
jgi:hypothetical protein